MSGAHIVEAGELLSGIAQKYGLPVDDLVRWNGIENPDLITVGQKIELSGHEEAPPPEPEASMPDGTGILPADTTYVVQPGDTVSELAERFGKRWIDIAVANKLEDVNLIYAGQTLVIPAQGVARGPA